MRRYETIFILRPNVGEDEINKIIESTTQIILDEDGSIIDLNKWGMKKLAYLIKKETLGYYIYCDFAGTPAAVAEVERKFRIDDSVLKYMTIKTAASITDEKIQQIAAEISAQKTAENDQEAEAKQAENADETKSDSTDKKPVEKTAE